MTCTFIRRLYTGVAILGAALTCAAVCWSAEVGCGSSARGGLTEGCQAVWAEPTRSSAEELDWQRFRLEVLLTRARQQMDAGKVEAAVETCRLAERTGLWDARTYSLLGEAYLYLGRWTEAVMALRKSPQSRRDKWMLAQALVQVGWERHRRGRVDDAVRLWSEATRADSHNGVAWASLGLGHLAKGDLAAAVACCRRGTEEQQRDPMTWGSLGIARYVAGDLPGAEAALLRALDLDPASPEGLSNLAFLRLDQGRTEEAVSLWERALERRGTLSDAWAGLGVGRWVLGDREGAVSAYGRAARRDRTYRSWDQLPVYRFWSQRAARIAAEIIAAMKAGQ